MSTDLGAQLTLLRTVTVTDTYASFVQFQYSVHGLGDGTNVTLQVFIDDELVENIATNADKVVSPKHTLAAGTRVVKWVYSHWSDGSATSSPGAALLWIAFAGVGEGGAPVCVSCPAGYISVEGRSVCAPCPAGTSSNTLHSACEPCQWFQYNDLPGNPDGCQPCPDGSVSSSDHSACIGKVNITGPFDYSLKPFVQLDEKGSPILCEKSKFKHRCEGTFFGPVAFNESYYFLSVMNPGEYSHSSFARFDNFTTGYAFGVIEKRDLPVSHTDLNLPDEVCASDFSKMVVNLGTRIQAVDISEGGFNIAYKDGAVCDDNRRFASVVHFHCDKTAGDGGPQLLYVSDCVYHFTWDSRLACHACKSSELKFVKGNCFEGQRYSFYEENEKCLYPGAGVILGIEPCSETREVMRTWPIILGGICALFLIAVVVVLVYLCQRKKREYQRLVEYKEEPNRQIEL